MSPIAVMTLWHSRAACAIEPDRSPIRSRGMRGRGDFSLNDSRSNGTTRGRGAVRIGTSGWAYDWTRFYPASLSIADRLSFYAERFDTVELNYSFYHLPRPETYQKWAAQTPAEFVLALKASRLITHVQRLSGVRGAWRAFLSNARPLGARLGPVLVQLPPSLGADPARLNRFLRMTSGLREELSLPGLSIAIEARDPSWFEPGTLRALEKHGAALVFADSSRYPYPADEPLTTGFVYLRFHGPEALFASSYGAERLAPWAKKIQRWCSRGLDVHAYFNNDADGNAIDDANALKELVNGAETRPRASDNRRSRRTESGGSAGSRAAAPPTRRSARP
jgi:uncharacterized protein YecE (DUF72 family)